MKTKVGIVDGNAIFRKGLKETLNGYSNVNVIFEAVHGLDLINKLKSNMVDVIILEHKLPSCNAHELIKEIRKRDLETKVFVINQIENKDDIIPLYKDGINAYLLKDNLSMELDLALRVCMFSEKYYSFITGSTFEEHIYSTNGHQIESMILPVDLNDDEISIIQLISTAKTTKQIAKILLKTTYTIDKLRGKILFKTKCKNSAELAAFAAKYNLLSARAKQFILINYIAFIDLLPNKYIDYLNLAI